jgi:hypothetical protein
MSEVTFIIGGERISGEKLGEHLEDGAVRRVAERVRTAALAARCPVHGNAPENIVIDLSAEGGDGVRVDTAEPCCEKLTEALTTAVRAH